MNGKIKEKSFIRKPLNKSSISNNNIINTFNLSNSSKIPFYNSINQINSINLSNVLDYFQTKKTKINKPLLTRYYNLRSFQTQNQNNKISSKNNSKNKKKSKNELENYNKITQNNPQLVNEYFDDIYIYYLELSDELFPLHGYMINQNEINPKMRSILIDWLVDVHSKFHLTPETLYITVNIIDKFLSKEKIKRKNFQLLGITSLFITNKYEEIYPPELKDHVEVTDNAYNKKDVLEMESLILNKLEFNITFPTCFKFFEVFFEKFKKNFFVCYNDKFLYFARYLMTLSLIDYNMLKYTNSEIAISALYLSYKFIEDNIDMKLNNIILFYDNKFNESNIQNCVKNICKLLDDEDKKNFNNNEELQAVRNKFNKQEFLFVTDWKNLRTCYEDKNSNYKDKIYRD